MSRNNSVLEDPRCDDEEIQLSEEAIKQAVLAKRRSNRVKTSSLPAGGPNSRPTVESPGGGLCQEAEIPEEEVYEQQIAKLHVELKSMKGEQKVLKTNATKQSKIATDSKNLCEKLKGKLEMEKRKVKEVRTELQKKLKTAPIVASDDGEMRNILLKLGESCKGWSEMYAVSSETVQSFNMTERSNILVLLQSQYNAISENGIPTVFSGSMINCGELLLNAALTHLIWFDMLQNPLYFLRHASSVGGSDEIVKSVDWLVELGAGGLCLQYSFILLTDQNR